MVPDQFEYRASAALVAVAACCSCLLLPMHFFLLLTLGSSQKPVPRSRRQWFDHSLLYLAVLLIDYHQKRRSIAHWFDSVPQFSFFSR
ncbi:hypothetical protein B0H10DRAFT_1011127 [Mycena sp. CBHHK59/15]|nr:hypothetical protein B0H10DRAFT_1011127 [Mycena sp. CBHHK59/15]